VNREPLFNVPGIVLGLTAAFVIIHVVRLWVLTDEQDIDLLLLLAFIPVRYEGSVAGVFPGGIAAQVWTFVTYAFLHANWPHVGLNILWLLPFGSALARRFGAVRFMLFFAVTAAAGALAHLLTHSGEQYPVIGASAAVSGAMAAAMRFAFQRGGPLSFFRGGDDEAYRVPALPLTGIIRDPRVIAFVVVWFGINILFGTGTVSVPGEDQTVAWEAHIGGFVAGLLLFSLFDPAVRRAADQFDHRQQ
jgi:membrane associated rhomboid family serine protease